MSAPEWAADLASRRAELLRRLRSGEYAQGRGQLRSPADEFCCLGVIGDMAVEAGCATWERIHGPGAVTDGQGVLVDLNLNAGVNYLPPGVTDWIGLVGQQGDLGQYGIPQTGASYGIPHSLANANDSGFSFAEIADLIEATPSVWLENR